MNECRGDHLSVAPALLDRDHALGPATMTRVFDDRRALAIAVFGSGEHRLLFVFGDQHRDHALTTVEQHAAHAVSVSAHRSYVGFLETYSFASGGKEHHIVLEIGRASCRERVKS